MAAMMDAFTRMLEQVRAGKPLDGALFEQYHGHAVAGYRTGKASPCMPAIGMAWRCATAWILAQAS